MTLANIVTGGFLVICSLFGLNNVGAGTVIPHLETVDCWFGMEEEWPNINCYYMHVPQQHERSTSSEIAFPVVRFKSKQLVAGRSPVLHLGAGGPGAPMYLDSADVVYAHFRALDGFSVDSGRDLYLIDPRGSGISKPLLTCQTYVDNVTDRWSRTMSRREEWESIDVDYLQCIEQFRSEGIDFSTYSSSSVAEDIELLRKAAGVDQWILLGVSYGSTYAQVIFDKYPQSVKALILDSSTFPHLKGHDNYKQTVMAPFLALFDYCEIVADCVNSINNFEQRFWDVYNKLQDHPLKSEVVGPDGKLILSVINGDRFVAALMDGVYSKSIFSDLPKIILDLENSDTRSLKPYLESYLAYLLDEDFGDVSASAHYCNESKPFTDFDKMRQEARTLPEGYIREMALFSLDWPDYCDSMKTEQTRLSNNDPIQVSVPTLFLHGEIDTVTRLDDVMQQKKYFPRSAVAVFPVAHSVLTSTSCAEVVANRFLETPDIVSLDMSCPASEFGR